MIIAEPDPYLLPSYRLSPFATADVHRNARLPHSCSKEAETYFQRRFAQRNYTYVRNGRAAIHQALSYYNLQPDDVVTIITTTDNFYISGCVTREIEKYCRWSRKVESQTKLLFVNHEFGFPREDVLELKQWGFPIIEDCAYSFFSQGQKQQTGYLGDFTIYSFPKIFPIQIGGLLTSRREIALPVVEHELNPEEKAYIQKVVGYYLREAAAIKSQRRSNHDYLEAALRDIGCTPRLSQNANAGIIPGAFLFSAPEECDLPRLKEKLWRYGIQCSVFYGEQAFYIPVHQRLAEEDLCYFTQVIKSPMSIPV